MAAVLAQINEHVEYLGLCANLYASTAFNLWVYEFGRGATLHRSCDAVGADLLGDGGHFRPSAFLLICDTGRLLYPPGSFPKKETVRVPIRRHKTNNSQTIRYRRGLSPEI